MPTWIPTAFKYLSKLLLMPTGDRGKGLQFIEYAASHPGFMRPEFEAILGNVYLLFEGRFEDGLRATVELAERYPANPRIAMPLALMLPFDPAGVARQTRRVEDTIERVDLTPQDMPERYALTLLEFLVAYADRFIATTDVAAAKLGRIADLNPKHPDWVGGYAGFELGRLMASLGEVSEARTAFDWVTHNPRAGYLHEDAKRLSHALRDIDRSANIPQSMWVREIYYGSAEDRRNAVEAITASAATPASEFYLGEASLLGGNLDEALASYENVVASRVDPWAEEFQMLASCRIAEIHGARGDYDGASQWLGKATEYYQKEFLVDWLLEGRRLFYERLRDGKSQAGPQAGPYILTGAP
jgi:tetratricopeptide (TPR) repeat protein